MVDSRLVERRIACPYCAETIEVIIDVSVGSQSYIEDCQVCCQPIVISFAADDGDLLNVRVERAQ